MTARAAPAAPVHRLPRLVVEHGPRLLRYCGVSAVSVAVAQSVLAVCLEVFDMGAVVSTFWAATIATVPAYVLSRRWVWRRTGRDSLTTEVLPFWVVALIGLALALGSVALVERVTDHTVVIMASMLGSSGAVWVVKYLVLDRFVWNVAGRSEPRPTVGASTPQ